MPLLELEAGQGHVMIAAEWSHSLVGDWPCESLQVLLAFFELCKREGDLAAVLVPAGLL